MDEGEQTWHYVLKRGFDLFEKVVSSVLSPLTILGLTALLTVTACVAMYTGSWSAAEIIAVAAQGSEMAKNGAIAAMGWIVAVAELVFLVPVIYFGYRINKVQGEALRRYRDVEDPMRASSQRPDALATRAMMTPEQLIAEAKGAD